ncbi:proprotein convertase subtilisin/kexin type 4 [Manacus vitellinus]|uniref:proprotein convertase subtilisin/kexin type 4 n=1 Tax=Manacus vitellinus TaxID=328815 RepID=UPI00115DBCF7|nr:proprotein convertase subtilisin/kexin type 4 [Manacus vitellinus]
MEGEPYYHLGHRGTRQRALSRHWGWHVRLMRDPEVLWFEQQTLKRRTKRGASVVPTDPWFPKQWYMNNDISPDLNILTAWSRGYTGRGVVLTILDDGLEKDHPDLAANYVTTRGCRHRLLQGGGSPGRGGAGAFIPPQGLCSGNSASPGPDHRFGVSHSEFSRRGNVRTCTHTGAPKIGVITAGCKASKAGKPSRAQQGRRDKSWVFATTQFLWVVVPPVRVPLGRLWGDLVGPRQLTYPPHDLEGLNPTLKSQPRHLYPHILLASSPALSWRDLQHLIIRASKPAHLKAEDWAKNGVGRRVSHYYGYGLLDAGLLVQEAMAWAGTRPQEKCSVKVLQAPRDIGSKLTISTDVFSCSQSIRSLEHVQVQLSLSYSRRGDLVVALSSPTGTTSMLVTMRPYDTSQEGYKDWTFMSTHFWDENPKGTWTLHLENKGDAHNTGQLTSFILHLHGTDEDMSSRRSAASATDGCVRWDKEGACEGE